MPSFNLPQGAKPFARGLSAEVYAWGQGQILKLFLPRFPPVHIDYEATCSAAISRCDLPVARLIERVDIDERHGLVFERIAGPSGLETIGRQPWRLFPVLHAMAQAQHRINQTRGPAEIHALHDRLAHHIAHQKVLSEAERDAVLAGLARLPRGDSLCHADLHPGQMILSPQGPVVIDWANAARGVPAADIARSWLLLRLGPPIANPWLGAAARFGLALTGQAFLAMRLRLTAGAIRKREAEAWLLPLLAARLYERVPGEEARLLRAIRRRLRQASPA